MVKLREACLAQAQASRRSDLHGRRFNSLAALQEAARLGDPSLDVGNEAAAHLAVVDPRPYHLSAGWTLRNEAAACLAVVDMRPAPGRLPIPPGLSMPIAGSRFQRYARLEDEQHVVIASMTDGRELLRLQCPGKCYGPEAWSPDERYLAVRLAGELLIWDLARPADPPRLKIQPAPAGIVFSPDSRQAVLSLGDGTLRLIEVDSGKELLRLERRTRPFCVAFHPGGRRLAVSSTGDPDVIVYDLETGREVKRFHHAGGVRQVAWRPDGRQLAACCQAPGFHIYLWDVVRNQARLLEGHQAEPTDVAFSHRGDLLASYGWDTRLRLWDPMSGTPLLAWMRGDAPLVFSPDDRVLNVGLRRFEVATAREYRCLLGHEGGKGPRGVDVSPDGRLIASASADGIRLWDAALAREVAWLPCGEMNSVLFHPAGGGLIASGPGSVFRWTVAPVADTKAEKRLRVGRRESLRLSPGGGIRRSCLSADGQALFLADRAAQQLRQFDLNARSWKAFAPTQPNMSYVAVSPDGRWIVTGPQGVGPVTVWDARTGKPARTLMQTNPAFSAFSPDGKWLVVGTEFKYLVWEVRTWQLRREMSRDGLWPALAFSPDGRMLATVPFYGLIRLTEPETGREVVTLWPPDLKMITWLRFSPDGSRLVASTENHAVQVWDLRLLRKGLAEVGLDWDAPPYPPAAEPGDPVPVVVEVDESK